LEAAGSIAISRVEERLLRALCKPGASDSGAVESCLGEPIDWPLFADLCKQNRVIPRIRRRLDPWWASAVPPEQGRELDMLARALGAHLLGLAQEMLALLEACEAERIEALPYKGPVLASLFYDDLAERQYRDIDLLVHERDVPRVGELLLARGWTARESLDEEAQKTWLARDCELHFDREGDRALELHWHVLPRALANHLRTDSLWDRLVAGHLAGVPIRTFSVEDWLVLTCIHGGDKHRWTRLQMILDVAQVLARHPDLDWESVQATAREIGRERTVLLGVFLAWDLLDAPLDRAVLERIAADPVVRARAALLRGRPFDPGLKMPSYRSFAAASAEQDEHLGRAGIAVPSGPRLARYLGAALEPDFGDRQAFELPPALGFLHWGLRPVRIFARHGLGILRRIGSLRGE
jgi:hypothetical protein